MVRDQRVPKDDLADTSRFLFETGYPESAMPFLKSALSICEELPQKDYSDGYCRDEQVLLADVLFRLATLSADQKKPKDALTYSERHFDVRFKAENRKQAIGRHGGLAYTEVALAYLLNDRFEAAIKASRAGRAILEQLPLFKEGKYWPDFAIMHDVMALIGLQRDNEAIQLLEEAIEFREKKVWTQRRPVFQVRPMEHTDGTSEISTLWLFKTRSLPTSFRDNIFPQRQPR